MLVALGRALGVYLRAVLAAVVLYGLAVGLSWSLVMAWRVLAL